MQSNPPHGPEAEGIRDDPVAQGRGGAGESVPERERRGSDQASRALGGPGLEEVVPRMACVGAGTMARRKCGLEVRLGIRHGIPGRRREWCSVCGSDIQGTDTPGAPPPYPPPLGKTEEPQIDAHSQAEEVLITHSVGDGSSEEEKQSYGLATPKL